MIRKVVASAVLAVTLCSAAERPAAPARGRKLWWASVAALAAASVFDARSSWGKQELNPLLRGPAGRFDARSIEIKTGIVASGLFGQWLALRRRPRLAAPLGAVNAVTAGLTAAAAAHNTR